MSAHTDAHPAERTIGSDRVVVLGMNYGDARLASKRHIEIEDDTVVVSASSHPGAIVGMNAAKVYITPDAHRGQHYELARENFTLKGAELVHLQGEGGTFGAL